MPLFVCMPPWNDVTLHDMVARTMLRGGVIYRDVFDTNLPGIDWSMAAVRYLFGWSYEALRAVDLVVIGAIVVVLYRWARRCGGTGYAGAWFVAGAALFYLFQSEFIHVQRDTWMMLPAVIAAWLRVKRVRAEEPNPPAPLPEGRGELSLTSPLEGEVGEALRAGWGGRAEQQDSPSPPTRRLADSAATSPSGGEVKQPFSPLPSGKGAGGFGSSLIEGFVWGLAVWVKPHVVVPASAVWVTSAVLLARREPSKRVLADLAGLFLGGILAGVPGVVWLVASGAWPYFLDIFLNWNPDYLSESGSLLMRWNTLFDCFRPWSNLNFVALPLAILALWEARVWSRRSGSPAKVFGAPRLYLRAETESVASARALLSALYLGWIAQAVLLQKAFDYVHTPVTFLGMAVLASHRWCFAVVYILWFVVAGVLVNVAEVVPSVAAVNRAIDPADSHIKLEKHPLADRTVVQLWPRCWTEGSSPELRDKLGKYTDVHCGTKWQELGPVAGFLRAVDPPLRAGELNCWHDGTHPLYLMLDLDPATRYMHYGTAFGIRSKRSVIADEVQNSRQRYVVSDLLRMTWDKHAAYEPESWRAGDPLPVWLPPVERRKFPWNQPVVFRSGRYVVHKIDPTVPLGVIRVPDWNKLGQLDQLGPAE